MKVFITIAFLLSGMTTLAQTLPGLNTFWKVQERETNQTTYPDTATYCIEYALGDSILTYGKWYNTLYCNGPGFSNDTVALLRTLGNQVIARTTPNNRFSTGTQFDTTEYVLYDFGLNINDTIELKFQGNLYSNNRENKEVYRVAGKDSVQTVNGKRLRLKLVFQSSENSFPNSGYSLIPSYGDTLYWIEGIGTPQGFYYPIDGSDCKGFFPDSFLHKLICMHSDSVLQYQTDSDCDCMKDQDIHLNLSESVSVYPNPFSRFLKISVPAE
ncbi:MAG: hypothetical protein ACPF9D_14445, partial [Owenweeksia sp.]